MVCTEPDPTYEVLPSTTYAPAIEDAIRAQQSCGTSLDVRVIVTDKGLYVLAQTLSGKSFEADVADASVYQLLGVKGWKNCPGRIKIIQKDRGCSASNIAA